MDMNKTLVEKSFDFAIRIIELERYLSDEGKSFALSNKLLTSGTNIGLYARCSNGKGKEGREMLKTALFCAEECEYIFDIMITTGIITENQCKFIKTDCAVLKNLLTEHLNLKHSAGGE
jgi:four helix bundle protein